MNDLTEQWQKGELKLGEHYYYTTIFSPTVYIQNFTRDVVSFQDFKETVAEVLAPVPSYEEWQSMDRLEKIMLQERARLYKQVIELLEENTKLKELLKECKHNINIRGYTDTHGNLLLPQIEQALGEDK